MLKKFCKKSGCTEIVESGYCDKHKVDQKEDIKSYDKKRGSSSQRGYGYRWQRYRLRYLKKCPLCVQCLEQGLITPATVVDHIVPHKGDKILFWDTKNHQPLCKRCHDIKTASEDGGFGNN